MMGQEEDIEHAKPGKSGILATKDVKIEGRGGFGFGRMNYPDN